MLMIWGIRWRWIWECAIFLVLWRESRPVTGIARILKHAAVVMITLVKFVEYWVASLEVLARPLYG